MMAGVVSGRQQAAEASDGIYGGEVRLGSPDTGHRAQGMLTATLAPIAACVLVFVSPSYQVSVTKEEE